MTSIIKLEVISGAMDDSPLCYMLQVDQYHFLLDCGWDERFDMAYMETLRRRVPHIDAVLLSYADIAHIGALPYLVGKCGLDCPIYATVPVFKMGQMFLYDWFFSHQNVEDFELFSLDDIDAVFQRVQQVKYNQQVSLKGKGHGLQITPCIAGHMIGGTIWRVTKMGEEEIVYAVDFNHKKERHLNGCTFDGISRPNVLITDANTAMLAQPRRKLRDEQLLTNILNTLRTRGDVLIVIDTAGRVLEIAHLLDQLWSSEDAGLGLYPLIMMSNVAQNVVEFAKSQVEWMSEKVMRSFEEYRTNPFELRNVQLVHSMREFNRVCQSHPQTPKIVLASQPDMEAGFSRELFLEWCADPRNSIILTQRAQMRSLAAKLTHMALAGEQVCARDTHTFAPVLVQSSRLLTLQIRRRIRLEGAELDAYYAQRRDEERTAMRARLDEQRRAARASALNDSDSDSDDEVKPNTAAPTAATQHTMAQAYPYDVMHRLELQSRSSFFKQSKRANYMYPFTEEKSKFDEYGEVIRPEDYTVAESLVPTTQFNDDDDTVDKESVANAREVPTKCIKSVTKLEALCKFEGVSDGESIKRLLSQIKPRQLILIHGSSDATHHLADYAKANGIAPDRVFTPRVGDVVDATIESHIYQVTLSDSLMCSLLFQPVKDAELSWIDAKITIHKPDAIADQSPVDAGALPAQPEEMQVSLDLLPSASIPPHTAVFLNDPKLSDLKQLLQTQGFRAEFSLGVLYVNSVVSIKKLATGEFKVEGTLCDDFYRIRHIVYGQFAIV